MVAFCARDLEAVEQHQMLCISQFPFPSVLTSPGAVGAATSRGSTPCDWRWTSSHWRLRRCVIQSHHHEHGQRVFPYTCLKQPTGGTTSLRAALRHLGLKAFHMQDTSSNAQNQDRCGCFHACITHAFRCTDAFLSQALVCLVCLERTSCHLPSIPKRGWTSSQTRAASMI